MFVINATKKHHVMPVELHITSIGEIGIESAKPQVKAQFQNSVDNWSALWLDKDMNEINYTEQHGILEWWAGFSRTELKTMRGHFMVSYDGCTVIARKVRGRNHWQLCNIADVESFEPLTVR